MTPDQKAQVIKQMYQHEGGSGALFDPARAGTSLRANAIQGQMGQTSPDRVAEASTAGRFQPYNNLSQPSQNGLPFTEQSSQIPTVADPNRPDIMTQAQRAALKNYMNDGAAYDQKYREFVDENMKAPVSTSGITGSDPKAIISQVASMDIPATQRTQLSKGLVMLGKLDSIVQSNPSGTFGGSVTGGTIQYGLPAPLRSSQASAFIANEAKLRQDLVNYITGAAYTSLQEKDVNNIIPRYNLSDEENQRRIENLYNTIISDAEGALVASGYNVQIPRKEGIFGSTGQTSDTYQSQYGAEYGY